MSKAERHHNESPSAHQQSDTDDTGIFATNTTRATGSRFCKLRWRLLVMLLSTAVTLSGGLLVLKLAKRWYNVWYSDYGSLTKADLSRDGGHLLPNMDLMVKGQHLFRPVRWITNSKGFRNEKDFNYEVPANTLRVLFMGDSFVDGFRTDQRETIGYRLEQLLKSDEWTGKSANVNVMISGQNNPAISWYRYQEHGYKYSPNLVVLGITIGNDITPRSYKSSLWPLRHEPQLGGTRLVASQPKGQPIHDFGRSLMLPVQAFLEEVRRAGDSYQRTRRPNYGTVPVIGQPTPNKPLHVHAGGNLTSLGLFYWPLLPEVNGWFRDIDEIIFGIKQEVDRRGSKIVVVAFPTRFQVDPRDWQLLTWYYGLDPTRFDLDYPNRRISQICRRHGIRCIDPTEVLRNEIKTKGSRLFMKRGDMHMNADGQALVAKELAKQIPSVIVSPVTSRISPEPH